VGLFDQTTECHSRAETQKTGHFDFYPLSKALPRLPHAGLGFEKLLVEVGNRSEGVEGSGAWEERGEVRSKGDSREGTNDEHDVGLMKERQGGYKFHLQSDLDYLHSRAS
jgi:hypothetical protein